MKTFVPDTRNHGGEQAIANLLTNHYSSLLNTKSIVNSREKSAKSGARPRKKELDITEVLVSMKKVEKAGSYTDHLKPETYDLANKLSENKTKKNNSKKNDQPQNMKNMQERIDRYSKPIEKKKNEYNHESKPVFLFRNSAGDKSANIIVRQRKSGDVFSMLKKKATSSKHSKSIKLEDVNLKEKILEEIITKNIWTDDDLEMLFSQISEDYKMLPDSDITEAIKFVKNQIL